MKKILLSIFALSCLTLQAQDFSVEVLDTTIYGSPTETTFFEDIDLYNNVGSTFSMNWERIEESVPAGWTTSNCDPDLCHPEGVTSASFTLPTSTSFLNTHFYPNGVAGSGYMKVKLWVSSNPTESTVLTYYGVAGTVGIDELEASDIQVFPTLAATSLTIMLPNPGQTIDVDIYNLSGQRVNSFQMTSENTTNLDVSALTAGMYFLNFNLDGKGTITKKFIKK